MLTTVHAAPDTVYVKYAPTDESSELAEILGWEPDLFVFDVDGEIGIMIMPNSAFVAPFNPFTVEQLERIESIVAEFRVSEIAK